jgi:SanA protein
LQIIDRQDKNLGKKSGRGLKMLLILAILAILCPVVINGIVLIEKKNIVSIDQLKPAQAVMILGARVYANGKVSDVLYDRMQTAFEVYMAGKAEKILISGDHGRTGYDEVNAMRKYLINWGVPAEDIFMDHAGFTTYESMYRAKEVFQIQTMIISTQEFHLPRSLFIAKGKGIIVQGIKADKQKYRDMSKNNLREFLARVKDFFTVQVFRPRPTYLGPALPISGDGRISWDEI